MAYAQATVIDSSIVAGQGGERTPRPVPVASRSNANTELLLQMEQLQMEVQALRGMVERQQHLIDRMQREQRDRYLDLDRRISQLTSVGAAGQATPVGTPTVSPDVDGKAPIAAVERPAKPAKDAYREAFALVRQRQFDEAITAFNDFIQQYPDSRLLANSHYWLGEVYMAKERTEEAEQAFNTVITQYPDSRKVPDAIYKLGLVYARYGRQDQARAMMEKVKQQHPGSSAAKLADAYLRKM